LRLITTTACDRQADGSEKALQELAAGETFGGLILSHRVHVSTFSRPGQQLARLPSPAIISTTWCSKEVMQYPTDREKMAPGPDTVRVTRRRFLAARRVLKRQSDLTAQLAKKIDVKVRQNFPIGGCRPGSAAPRIFSPTYFCRRQKCARSHKAAG